jgi:hypothetical protein
VRVTVNIVDGPSKAYALSGVLVAVVLIVAGLMGTTNVTFPVGFLSYIYLAIALVGSAR